VAYLIFEDAVSTQEGLSLEAGRGMGLSSLANAIKNAQGSIELNFVKGKGSEFRIFLPKQAF
jgi:chemotaxis protein histidine kinase CheA